MMSTAEKVFSAPLFVRATSEDQSSGVDGCSASQIESRVTFEGGGLWLGARGPRPDKAAQRVGEGVTPSRR